MLAVGMSAMFLVPSLFSVGIPAALLHFGARGALSRSLYIRVLGSVLGLSALGAFALSVYAAKAGPDYRDTLLVVAVGLPLVLPLDCLRALLQADRRFGAASAEAWMNTLTRFVGIVVLAAFDQLTSTSAMLLILLTSITSTAMWITRAARILASGRRSGTQVTRRAFLSYSSSIWLGQFAGMSNARIDQIILALLISAYDIGIYAVAVVWAQLPLMVVSASQRVILVKSGNEWDDAESGRVTRITTALGGAMALGLAVLAPLVIPLLFGSAFGGAVSLTYLLLPGMLAGFTGYMFSAMLAARGRAGSQTVGEVGGLIVTVAGLAILVPGLGVEGAAITSSVCYATTALLWLRFLRQHGFAEPVGLPSKGDLAWLRNYFRRSFRPK